MVKDPSRFSQIDNILRYAKLTKNVLLHKGSYVFQVHSFNSHSTQSIITKRRFAFLFVLFFFNSPNLSWASTQNSSMDESDTEYGELFFLEKKNEKGRTLFIKSGLGYVFSNPYYNSITIDSSVQFALGKYLLIGPFVKIHNNSKTDLSNQIEQDLEGFSFSQSTKILKNTFHGKITFIPFSGHLSFFGFTSFPVELQASIAPGFATFETGESGFAFNWSTGVGIGFTKLIYLNFELGQIMTFGELNTQDTNASMSLGLSI